MSFRLRPSWSSPIWTAAVCGAIAFVAAASALDAAGDYPHWREGPGLTLDESFNVQQGVLLATQVKPLLLFVVDWREVFQDQAHGGFHLPDHPPLGRLWLGAFHQLVTSFAPPRDHPGPFPFVTSAARAGSAAAFALTVFLVGWMAGRWYGRFAGAVAAVSLLLMPRPFGHAHIASLETCIGLAYAAATLAAADAWGGAEPPRRRTAFWTGLLFGAALLTKIQAVFLPVAVGAWALVRWRLKGLRPVLVWGLTGTAALFLCWPWLWFDPAGHFLQYLGRTTNRVVLNAWYFGQRYADRDVPWHYPWVMFAATTPLVALVPGLFGLGRVRHDSSSGDPGAVGSREAKRCEPSGLVPLDRFAWRSPREALLLAAIIVPLAVFSVPGVAVYDGERLFLVVFPLFAVFAGRCAALAQRWLAAPDGGLSPRRRLALGAGGAALAIVGAVSLVRMSPCWLSGYGAPVGTLSGASRLGFEPTYWGDSVTRRLLVELAERVPEGATVDVTPVLHQHQLSEMLSQSPPLRRRRLRLRPLDPAAPGEYLLTFTRRADLPPELPKILETAESIATVERSGVTLAAAYRLRPR